MAEYPFVTGKLTTAATGERVTTINCTCPSCVARRVHAAHTNNDNYTLNDYQDAANSTAIYPGGGTHSGINYTILGLIGEAGELANKYKKYYRDAPDNDRIVSPGADDNRLTRVKEELKAELGDVLWYVACLAAELDVDLSVVARENIAKLKSRKDRDQIKGSGDYR